MSAVLAERQTDSPLVRAHLALTEWGNWARGGIPGGIYRPPDEPRTLNDPLCAEVEAALLVLRDQRRQLYKLARLMYLHRLSDDTLERDQRWRGRRLYRAQAELWRWIAGRLRGES